MSIKFPIGLGVLALCLVACGSGAGDESVAGGLGAPADRLESTREPSFLAMIQDAHERVAYTGTRKVWLSYDIQGRQHELAYEERVTSDGRGGFSLEPGEVLTPRMSDVEKQLFTIDQTRRASSFFLHRDFRVRDLDLFLRNYAIEDTGVELPVAGVACAHLEVRRRSDGRLTHRAAIDPKTGLVMKYDELDATGRSIAQVEFTAFTLDPDLAGVELEPNAFAGTPFRLQDSKRDLGFEMRTPTFIPSGYRLMKSDRVVESSQPGGPRTWARLTYGDGAEQIFFLYSNPEASSSGLKIQSGGAPAPRDEVDPDDAEPRTVKFFQAGPLSVAQYTSANEQAIVIGKVDEAPLIEMLQSAMQ